MKNVFATLIAFTSITLTGCATPDGVGWRDYYFGASDPAYEAELVCLRYPGYFPNCDVAKLETLASEAHARNNGDCKDFTKAATTIAKEWGLNQLGYIYIEGTPLRDGHVALLVKIGDEKYVVDNGSSYSPIFGNTGTLADYRANHDREVHEVPRPFLGAEAEKHYDGSNLIETLAVIAPGTTNSW